ncbi:MAG TPA: hypothetical protein VIK24_11335 [Pyrinomonadaceae bacterium]
MSAFKLRAGNVVDKSDNTQSFFRNFFVTDIFYLLTGLVTGGSSR